MTSKPDEPNGRRKIEKGKPIEPTHEVEAKMRPITERDFERLLERAATPTSPRPAPKAQGK